MKVLGVDSVERATRFSGPLPKAMPDSPVNIVLVFFVNEISLVLPLA